MIGFVLAYSSSVSTVSYLLGRLTGGTWPERLVGVAGWARVSGGAEMTQL